jgi:membrane protein implicated in regulation of membrane protease activity
METIGQIISFTEEVFARFPMQTTPTEAIALAVILITALAVLSALPLRFVAVLALLSLLGLLALIAPGHEMILFATGCGLAALIYYRRRSATMQKQLDELTRSVHDLQLAANRWLIHSLNSTTSSAIHIEDRATPSIVPMERADKDLGSKGSGIR